MFTGTFEPKLDDKGRVFLPAKIREDMGEQLVLTKGQDRCIYVYPVETFNERAQSIISAPTSSKQVRSWRRVFMASAFQEAPDRQGRISLPAELRSYAGLGRQLTVIGVGDHAEIWNSEAWEEVLTVEDDAFSDTNEEIFPGMF